MVSSVQGFSRSRSNGLFISSCFAHCQSEQLGTWNSVPGGSPTIQNKVTIDNPDIHRRKSLFLQDEFKGGTIIHVHRAFMLVHRGLRNQSATGTTIELK
jgi:hypothetical protein